MRCLLEEFRRGTPRRPTVIVGFREHIFTGSVSSLANYMALQELSFVTLGQRVLSNPLRVRMHYGHPDVFDKVFYMTAGGISKASKGINLSEDIFAGYNGTIRGGQVRSEEEQGESVRIRLLLVWPSGVFSVCDGRLRVEHCCRAQTAGGRD